MKQLLLISVSVTSLTFFQSNLSAHHGEVAADGLDNHGSLQTPLSSLPIPIEVPMQPISVTRPAIPILAPKDRGEPFQAFRVNPGTSPEDFESQCSGPFRHLALASNHFFFK